MTDGNSFYKRRKARLIASVPKLLLLVWRHSISNGIPVLNSWRLLCFCV